MKNVLVIGSINMDLTVSTDRMPKLGETVTGTGFSTYFGGKGANQAIALAKQGSNVRFIGAVGNDPYGSSCIENFKNNNIEFHGRVIEGVSTGVAVITVCGGDNCIILHGGANDMVDKTMLSPELFDWADIVVMQLEIPLETVIESAKIAKQHNCITVLNPAPARELPDELLAHTDIIIPNEYEAQLLTGIECIDEESSRNAVFALKEKGVKQVIITLGSKGCAFTEGDLVVFKSPYKTKAVDTTAAGDSFIGGLCSALIRADDLSDAVDYASMVSSITVSRHGASVSIPTKEEVMEIFKL